MAGSNNKPYINPRFRAYGRARIDIAQRAQTRADWDRMWKKAQYPFAFTWGEPWRQCIEYRVDDFAAEVGFFIDILGLPVRAFSPEFAMFTSPDEAFNFAVVPTPPGMESTPPDAFRFQFNLDELFDACEALAQRGVIFDQQAQPVGPNSHLWIAAFRSPHGIPIELWGMVSEATEPGDEAYPQGYAEEEAGQFADELPDEAEMEAAFQAARQRVSHERPELAASVDEDENLIEDEDQDEEDSGEALAPRPAFKAPGFHRPSANQPAGKRTPEKQASLKTHQTAEEMLASLGSKPVIPAPKPSPASSDDSRVRTFEPTYESVEDEEDPEPGVRSFPQEYHYRPIRLSDPPEKDSK